MVNAMGPLGVEGTFRRCCEITLQVIIDHKDTLISVLRPFIYDPLVSWQRQNPELGRTTEFTNENVSIYCDMLAKKFIEDI